MGAEKGSVDKESDESDPSTVCLITELCRKEPVGHCQKEAVNCLDPMEISR